MCTTASGTRSFTRARLFVAVFLVMAGAATTGAQEASGVTVSGGLIGEFKRFSGDPEANNLNGETTGGTLGVGLAVARQWDLALDLDLPRTTEVIRERTMMLRLARVSVQSVTRNRATTVAALVRFRPGAARRVRMGYVAGLSFVRLWEAFETRASPQVPVSLLPLRAESIHYTAAPTVGAEAQIELLPRLSVVPAFYATPFSAGEVSGVLLRPRISVRWTF